MTYPSSPIFAFMQLVFESPISHYTFRRAAQLTHEVITMMSQGNAGTSNRQQWPMA